MHILQETRIIYPKSFKTLWIITKIIKIDFIEDLRLFY